MTGTGATKKVVQAQLLKYVAKVMWGCIDDCHSRTTGGLIESELKNAAFLSQRQICCERSLTVMVYDKLVFFRFIFITRYYAMFANFTISSYK